MQQVTLQPGDYVATKGMTEEQYHAVARAFMNAGALGGESPDYRNTKYPFMGWADDVHVHGLYHGGVTFFARHLEIDEVLNATNAGNAAPPSPMNCRCVMTPITKETDMHITDKLYKARKECDEAQARYEQALAEHRETYPWLAIEERSQPASGVTERLQQTIAENYRKMHATDDMTEEDEVVNAMYYDATGEQLDGSEVDDEDALSLCRVLTKKRYRKQSEPAEDMTDPANWRAGDVLECVDNCIDEAGSLVIIESFDEDGDVILRQDKSKKTGWTKHSFRFHSRP